MTKLERVLRTMRFEETDRVPLYDILQNDAIIEHYAGRALRVEDGMRTTCLAVGRALDMTRMVSGPQEPRQVDQADGFSIQYERWTSWIVSRPFHDLPGLLNWVQHQIRELNATVCGPEDAARLHDYIEARWAEFAESDPSGRRDPAVLVIESGVGLTEMYHAAGMDLFTELLMEHPDLTEEWLEARHQAELRRVRAVADPRWIPVALTYDDIACKNGPIFSPAWLRQFWAPRLKQLVEAWHERGAVCIFHSDGNLWLVLDDLVETGIDGLNPLEVMAGMSVRAVREQYPQLVLTGGIDVSDLLIHGTPEAVRTACRQALADTGRRGYFLGSTTELYLDVPLDNAVAMFESAWETEPTPHNPRY
jgi:hypothetical protein